MSRPSGRDYNALREVSFHRHYLKGVSGSVLVKFGHTEIICTAYPVENVPSFLKNSGKGWLTAEYGMLPCSTNTRMRREAIWGKQSGRTQEIQRLIGRSLRACLNMKKLGERQIIIDCDVIQADGGTRTASITGGYVALVDTIRELLAQNVLSENPLTDSVVAVSVGLLQGKAVLDLDYAEDSSCDTDMNIVMTGSGRFIEIQGTAEGDPFCSDQLQDMLTLAREGVDMLVRLQKSVLKD